MAELVKALGDFVAALLSVAGFVGRTRRRAAIRDDLELLKELESHEDFGRDTAAHTWLKNYIVYEVGTFSGVDFRTSRRKPQWGAAFMACFFWVPLGWLTYHLVDTSHPWYAVLPAVPGGLFFFASIGTLLNKEEVQPGEDEAPQEDVVPAST